MKADDRLIRAYLEVVRMVVLFVRLRSRGEHRLSDEHLFDLMDAIHNIPAFVAGSDDYFTHEIMQLQLGCYDERWANNDGLQLVRMLNEALSQHK